MIMSSVSDKSKANWVAAPSLGFEGAKEDEATRRTGCVGLAHGNTVNPVGNGVPLKIYLVNALTYDS